MYLRSIRQYRREDRPIIYLDETWANSHDGHARMWVEDACQGSTSGGIRKPSGKGNRLIVLHAGSREGWVKDAALVFQSKRGTGDYHNDMNHNTFEEWVTNQLFRNIPPRSVIVMDSASYHSRQLERAPTSNSRKADMIEWLDKHSVPYPDRALKRDLYQIIKSFHTTPVYAVDELVKASDHVVLCLPPYYCELNPIELAWSQVKGYVKENNKKFTLTEVKRLVHEGFDIVTPEHLAKVVQHVINIVDKFWEADGLHEDAIEEFIIRVGGSDSESDSDSESESSCDEA